MPANLTQQYLKATRVSSGPRRKKIGLSPGVPADPHTGDRPSPGPAQVEDRQGQGDAGGKKAGKKAAGSASPAREPALR